MIIIPKNITVEKIEEFYYLLNSKDNKQIDIKLPVKIETNEFGLLFSFIQFISTWIRQTHTGNLIIPIKEIDIPDYIFKNEFVYPTIVICWDRAIIDLDGNNLKKHFKEPSKEYFKMMDFFNLNSYNVPIYCFDFDKSNRGTAKSLYIDNDTLFSEEGLGFNLYPAYQKVGSFNKAVFSQNINKDLDSITAIIHELFSNTHEHAKTDENGNYLYPNIRAIQLKFHKKNLNTYKIDYKNFRGLANYFQSNFSLNSQNELYLLEISIIDSGPGLVKRYSGVSNLSGLKSKEEVDYIKNCLYRHNTSSDISISDTKGIGLDRVLQILDNKGFIRIKTGRVDVVRDVKTLRYEYHKNPADIEVFDFKTNSTTDFQLYPEATGTLISIFYPLTFSN